MALPIRKLDLRYFELPLSFGILIFILLLVGLDASYAQNTPSENEIKIYGTNFQTFKHIPRIKNSNRSVCSHQPNRTIDGTCNNIVNTSTMVWGATDIPLFREMPSAYGAPDFYNDMAGQCRLSPRVISNLVVAQDGDLPSPRNLSSLVFTWGQFLDHDIDLTPEGETEYVPILLSANEPLFTQPIPFLRSEPFPNSGVNGPREQENIITSWIDASQVYGSEETRAMWLRTFTEGKLKTSEGNLLPYNTVDGNLDSAIDPNAPSMAGDSDGTVKVFVAGDVRANEQPGLTSMHTLFVREHNRLCDQINNEPGSNFSDEEVYQQARKLVGAYMQNITYEHFLPALGVELENYNGYKPNVQPDISNIFASAAYRLGHTMVTDEIPLIAEDCELVDDGFIALLDGFFNPTVVQENGIEPLIQGLASQIQQKVDAKIVDNLRNFLFPVPGSNQTFGLDLASLNLQRGRDHGLPDYNAVRTFYGQESASGFEDITTDLELQTALSKAYGSVYDMDLWVGLLSEDPMSGTSIGPTLNAILSQQFEILRNGDYYFYQNDPVLSNQAKEQIRRTDLAEIIERNTSISRIQNNVFFARDCGDSPGGGNGPGGPGRPNRPRNDGGVNQININSSVDNNFNTSTLNLYPNPNQGLFEINFLKEELTQNVRMNIVDINGRIVYNDELNTTEKSINFKLDMSHLSPGLYIVKISSGDAVYTQRMMINKKE